MEIWKDIVGYKGAYQVSNLGNIKSLKFGKEKYLNPANRKIGYLLVTLSKNDNREYFLLHRLVCLAFLENPENKPFVNHKNGIRNDNRVENLEWCTAKENTIHRFKVLGRKGSRGKLGILNPNSKKVNQYTKQGEFIKTWDCMRDITRELGINQANITTNCKGIYKTTGGFIWRYYLE